MKKILTIFFVAAAGMAQAQTSDFVHLVPAQYLPKDVNFSIGAVALSLPKYSGSDERRAAVYPLFDAQWKNGAFFSAFNGLGYNFSKNPSIQYGLRMSLEAARDESRSSKLNGLGDVNTTLEPGAFFNYSINQNYSLVSSVRYGSGVDHNGLRIGFGGIVTTALNSQHRLSAILGANWSNTSYVQSYYGVNASQSVASGYSQFAPSSGISDVKIGASWHWNVDTNWSLTTGASMTRLTGDAGKSPFVFQKNPVTVFSSANYRF
ncbi:MipA/OmpV family protein [Undibacterium sp. SXout7W]|uniref:MipA/OmpV family protein n=1 Tax=Undibacterium sp. SXout7W TaxID=3413049 RepID=UPI003BF20A1E